MQLFSSIDSEFCVPKNVCDKIKDFGRTQSRTRFVNKIMNFVVTLVQPGFMTDQVDPYETKGVIEFNVLLKADLLNLAYFNRLHKNNIYVGGDSVLVCGIFVLTPSSCSFTYSSWPQEEEEQTGSSELQPPWRQLQVEPWEERHNLPVCKWHKPRKAAVCSRGKEWGVCERLLMQITWNTHLKIEKTFSDLQGKVLHVS